MRRRRARSAIAAAVAIAVLAGCGGGGASGGRHVGAPPPGPVAHSAASHVVVLVMENKEEADVVGAPDSPYVTRLAHRYGLAARSYAIRHPSLPNYLALTSGSTHGIGSDCTSCRAGGRNLADQLRSAHLTWRAYMDGMPRPCFRGAAAGGYAKKHDPFAYYDDVMRDPARCRRIVPGSRLDRDLRRGTLPDFALVVPDLCQDTHDCGVATGDRYLARTVPRLLRGIGPHGFLVLTWDEGGTDAGCCGGRARGGRIATVVAGPDVRRGARMSRPVDHYGVLRTVEDALGLPHLGGAADRRNGSLRPLFRRVPLAGRSRAAGVAR